MVDLNLSVACYTFMITMKSVIVTADSINLAHGFVLKELSIFFIDN